MKQHFPHLIIQGILAVIFIIPGLPGFAQPPKDDLTTQVDAVFREWDQPGVPGGVVGIVKEGELVLARAYGLASLEYEVPVTTETVFNVASVSKQFTAFSIILLAQEGKLSLKDDVRKYLPEVPDFGTTITIEHLMHHTSGLRNFQNLLAMAGWRDGDPMTNDDLLKYIRYQRELNFPPGSEYLYCNTGFNFMAEIVERVSGQSFQEFTRERIFEPLGMENSEFREDLETVNPNTATSYDGSPEEGFRRPKPFWAYVGNGNLCTTVGDLAKWVDNFRHHRVGGPEARAELTKRGVLANGDTISYARGIVVEAYRGLRRFQHGGSIGGFRASLMYFPDQTTGILVLSNFSSAGPSGKAAAVADIYLSDHFPEPKAEGAPEPMISKNAVEIAPSVFEAFEGAYFLEREGAVLKLYRESGRYQAEVEGTVMEVTPSSDSTFFVRETDMGFIGHRGADGTIERLTAFAPRRQTARRIDPEKLWSREALQQYTGEYYSPELQTTYRIVLEDDQLIVRHRRHNDFKITPVEPDQLQAEAYFFRDVKVERNGDDEVTGLRVTNGRVRNLRFERK